ncbi:hypothetical protein EG68_06354 [Paragonimus skrjabini miyazakii]|uniref:UTP23 sensor motif region domain-containing protein n=1 Tax=Paragonimus skrjabini miyazakii TaxID=59628 RepID=A0A8S9YU98_9TREM|nr:hypothetical protein EG68_06354 [Paragonimus skrjabini miyazakii]
MKIKRLKGYKRVLDAYSRHFGLILDPLEIFIDNTFARQALTNKLNIKDQFEISLKICTKLVTSTCVIKECEALGDLFQGTLSVLKQFKILQCKHPFDSSKCATWCIKRRIRSARRLKHKGDGTSTLFALASNDGSLQEAARLVPGMPVFYVAHCRFNLESPPVSVSEFLAQKAFSAPVVSAHEGAVIDALDKKFGLCKEPVQLKKRKRPRAPNPLSCKKKSRKCANLPGRTTRWKKRKRKRIKNTWAFQQVLLRVKHDTGIV